MSIDLKKQSNPFSTGGGGVNFETKVQASFAIALITQSCVPCLSKNMRAKELKFQNKYAGSNTDDFVLEASDKYGATSKLYAQIKHEITIGASTGSEENSSTFSDVIKSAWEDFKQSKFDRTKDKIALITGPLSQVDITNTLPLLEWAKYSANADEFIQKSETKGFTSKAKTKKLEALKIQLEHANGGLAITNEELWEFLKVFYLVSFDLDTQHSIVANLLCSLIQMYSDESPSLVLSKVITCIQEFNQNAGTLTLENLPDDVKELFILNSKADFESDLLKLQDHGNHIFNGISNLIQGFHVDRYEELISVSEAVNENDFVFVTGVRGTGKSGIVKDFVLSKNEDVPVFYFRAEDFDKSHLNEVFYSIGINSSLTQIESYFSLLPEKILVIESIEKILELNYQHAFIDLLQFIKQQSGWTIIATGRDYAFQQLTFNFLQPNGVKYSSVNIDGFTEEQIRQVCEHVPELKVLISNDALVDILRIPFFIEIAVRAICNGAQFQKGDTEIDFRNIVWSSVIAKEQDRKFGMPVKRRKTFIEIATQRAKKMVFGIPIGEFDPEVISKFEEDNLIYRDQNNSTVSLPHDVLEDWALEEFIEDQYRRNIDNVNNLLLEIGSEPAISRAFRLWLYRKLQYDYSIYEFVENILTSSQIESFWKDETIAAILQHDNPKKFLDSMKSDLLKDDCALLIRFCFILRITCQRPNARFTSFNQLDKKSGILKTLFLTPYGKGWEALISFIYEVRTELSKVTINHIVEVINDWCGFVNIYDDLPQESRVVGLLALWILEPLKNAYRNDNAREKILGILLKVSSTIETEFDQLMTQDIFVSKVNPRRLSYVDQLTSLALVGIHTPILCKLRPNFIIKLAMHEWKLEKRKNDNWYSYESIGNEERFGLDENRDFFPSSGAKGPFQYLLQYHPRKALDFIIELCNLTAEKNIEFSRKNGTDTYSESLVLDDGTSVDQFVTTEFWSGYTGRSNLPYLLQCALMALENWLINYVEHCGEKNEVDWIYDYLLRNSNSVMITSILASVAVGFPDKIRKAVFPILNIAEFYLLDISRSVHEMGGSQPHWFNAYDNDVMTGVYIEERKKSVFRSWRKETLEMLLTKLQFSDLREEAFKIVDNLKNQALGSDDISFKFLANRIDVREWEAIHDKENNRIVFQNKSDLPENLKQHKQEFDGEHILDNAIFSLNLWASELSKERKFNHKYFSTYKDALDAAQRLLIDLQEGKKSDHILMAVGSIATVAAICIRDDLENLASRDIDWCFNIILDVLTRNTDGLDSISHYDKTDHSGACACAYVLSKLFILDSNTEKRNILKQTLAIVLTHENTNVIVAASKGVKDFLWSIDSTLAFNCLNGIVEYTKFIKEERESRQIYHLNETDLKLAQTKWKEKLKDFRGKLINGDFKILIDTISLESHSANLIHLPMLMVQIDSPSELEISLIEKIVTFIFESESNNHRLDDEKKIGHEVERYIQGSLVEHLIQTKNNKFLPFKEILVSGCFKAPSFIYSVKLSFDVLMEKENNFNAIWEFWKILEPELHKIALVDDDNSYRRGQDIIRLLRGELYADTPWQGHESDRKCMEHGVEYLLNFADQSANNKHVFEALASLIYNFHDLFFDKGIQILANKFTKNAELILRQQNVSFYLEMSVGRYLQVENRGGLSRKMYQNCLNLLTGIVENGSARAYYLRENLVRSRKIMN